MKTVKYMVLLSIIIAFTSSCKKNNPVDDSEQPEKPIVENPNTKLGETYILGAKAKAIVYSKKSLITGYNEILVAFYDSINGSPLSSGKLTVTPIMDMGTMTHSAPVENSDAQADENGYFKSNVVFTMPGTASEWSLKLHFINNKNGLQGNGSIGVSVAASSPSKLINTTLSADSSRKIFISLLQPAAPEVGINNFEITVHQKSTMMDFPAVSDYTFEIEPEMPSMGHGSPNNVNPVYTGNGHYVGKVNYTMTGLWYIRLKIYKNGTLISNDQYFEMTLN